MNSNTKTIFHRIQSVEDELTRLSNILFTLKTTDIQKYPDNYGQLSTDAALRAERIACQLRNLVYATDAAQKPAYMKQAADVQGIRITMDKGILSIILPGLLPKRKVRTNTAFLQEPLAFVLQEYQKEHSITLYQNCVICFSQIYDRELPLRRIRDYDNLEFKQILDTIASYFLLDDTGLLCDAYYTTELGTHDCTEISVMEKNAFPEWFQNRKYHTKPISEIS